MRKTFFTAFVLVSLIAMAGCTNNEGDSDLDIITPTDSTQGKIETRDLPKV